MKAIFNVMGSKAQLEEMLKKFPLVVVEERFSETDWNVEIPDDVDYEERFTDWCDDNKLEAKFV